MSIPEHRSTGALDVLRLEGIALLQKITATLAELGPEAEEDRRRLQDVARDLRDSFFLVTVVGEFNAGKSSFINALLGDALLPVGITPTTAAIEIVLHAEQARRKPVAREDGLREWAHPGTGAPGVALVDTPGTGSVFASHERIALDFLHRSDLVLFVISARRALAETDRLYLELAKRYGKKIIIIINQIDQLEPAEQAEVRRFVERQARELLGLEPLIFMVSARQALEPAVPGHGAQAGMEALRAHLQGLIRQSPPAQQKLLAQLDLAERIAQDWQTRLLQHLSGLQADRARVAGVQAELEQQSLGLEARLQETQREIEQLFASLRRRGHQFLDDNLSLRHAGRARRKDALQLKFRQEVVGRSLQELDQLGSAYVSAMLDQSRRYWHGVVERLQQLSDLLEQEAGGLDAGVYASQREGLQEALRLARAELQAGVSDDALEQLRSASLTRLNDLASASVAALGALLVTLLGVAAPGPVVGAGAAVLALPAVAIGAPLALLGSLYALRKYRQLSRATRQEFDAQLRQMQDGLQEAMRRVTDEERHRLLQYGRQVLVPVYSRLDALGKRDQDRSDVLQGHLDAIARLRQSLEEQ